MPANRLVYYWVVPATIDAELLARQIEVALLHPPRCLGAPVGSAGLVGIWDPPYMGRPAQRVPVARRRLLFHRPRVAIRFRNLRGHSPSTGVHLADLFRLHQEPQTLCGAEDVVLHGFGGPAKELKFIIDWPGYEPQLSTIRTVSDNGEPLTRIELGRNIMVAYGRFFRKVVTERILPSRVGFYNIALHQGRDARPDSLGIHLWQLHLVAFRELAPDDDHWVAEIEIVPA